MLRIPVSQWTAQLGATDPTEAVRALAEHGPAALEAVEPLRAILLTGRSWHTRRTALDALSRIEQQPESSAVLALADEHAQVRIAASRILAYSSHRHPAAVYGEMLADPNHNVRANGFAALQRAADAGVPFRDAMVVGLADPWPSVRTEAARAIRALGPAGRSAIDALTERLHDADQNVVAAAACALSRLGELPPETIDALRALGQHDDVWVRKCVSEALHAR